jgi:Mg2+ and Co2+ transporter CorA
MKKILLSVMLFAAVSTTFAEDIKIVATSTTPVTTEVLANPPMDYDSMAGRPYYPNIMYPTLSQGDMLSSAIDVEKKFLTKAYGAELVTKIDNAITTSVKTAKTKAKTKEGQAMYLGEIISKIQQVQNYYGSYTSTPSNIAHVLNYMGYKLSMETIMLVYGNGEDLDSVLQLLQNK